MQTPEPKVPERAIDRLTAKYNSAIEKYEQECEDIAKKELEKILSSADKAIEDRRPEITFKVCSTGYQDRLEKILSLLTKKLEKDEGLTVVKIGVILNASQTSRELYQELNISGWAPVDTQKEEPEKPAPVMRGQEDDSSPEISGGPEDFGGEDYDYSSVYIRE